MTDTPLERTVVIRALPDTVFRSFTDAARFAAWWGPGSTIDPAPGGAVKIVYPNGIVASGEVEEIDPPHLIRFTFGYEDGAGPIPPGGSRVEFSLTPVSQGTRVTVRHHVDDAEVRRLHEPGWRHQLGLFANVAARAQHADLDRTMDEFFAAQMLDSLEERVRALESLVTEDFRFSDTLACVAGAAEFAGHLEAARAHGVAPTLERRGPVRHCQGTALCDWVARAPGGRVIVEGSNVVELAPDGRIARVTGLWDFPAPPPA